MIRTASRLLPALLALAPLAAASSPVPSLGYIGQAIVPTGTQHAGTTIGGLSGLDYDPATGRYFTIADDRGSATSHTRFYSLSIDLADGQLSDTDVAFQGVTNFYDQGGADFPTLVDPEDMRFRPASGTFYWIDEGNNNANGQRDPAVREMSATGAYLRELDNDNHGAEKYAADPGSATGIRNNLAFEALTLSADGQSVFVGMEGALNQDGPAASLTQGSPSRILKMDLATGLPSAEYVLVTDPVVEPPVPDTGFKVAGLVSLLAYSDTELLALERSFSAGTSGTGHTARLYLIDLATATDVVGLDDLDNGSWTAAEKRLVLDLETLIGSEGIDLDNLEGMTFGPTLPNGRRSLILVSDNNFSGTQFTQFLAFEVSVPTPAPAALMLGGLAALGWGRRRRG